MSKVRAEQYTNRLGTGAPEIPYGVTVPEGASINGAGGLNLTGIATAGTFKGDFSGNITGVAATFTSNVTIGGTLTYEDVTNIDSVGVITARSGIRVPNGNATGDNIALGNGNELQLWHNGTYSAIQADTLNIVDKTNGHGMITAVKDGKVGLRYDNIEKFATTSSGVKVTGNQTNNVVAMGANDVDCSAGSYFTKTITGATTFTFSNVPTGVEFSFTMEVTLNGSNAITWPSSVKWNADTAPTLTDGKTQLFMFLTTNGGTRFRGSALVDYVN